MGTKENSPEQAVGSDKAWYAAGYQAGQNDALPHADAAYDKGYDDGWNARDEMAGRNLKIAEDLAYDNGWIAGANAVINRKPYSALAGR